ncbi:hypothetical protein C9374_000200 [Naegleria lovaniensis]|uniref:Uncharacterized protein n=1 Tax=Naegleria lovaniensis TaxID=51637 RepID=A0AA88GZB4_NAELO|nr:uncharacterized protein C9374_000200 [Naegleria lovaniensis]KAG2388761.1 hypothetical protein C9374_000200 [Naegleria lovaniensis]
MENFQLVDVIGAHHDDDEENTHDDNDDTNSLLHFPCDVKISYLLNLVIVSDTEHLRLCFFDLDTLEFKSSLVTGGVYKIKIEELDQETQDDSTSKYSVRHCWWRRAMNAHDPIYGKDLMGTVKGLFLEQNRNSNTMEDNLVYVCDGGFCNRIIILKSLDGTVVKTLDTFQVEFIPSLIKDVGMEQVVVVGLENPISITMGRIPYEDYELSTSEENNMLVIGEAGGRIKVFTTRTSSNEENEGSEWKLYKIFDLNEHFEQPSLESDNEHSKQDSEAEEQQQPFENDNNENSKEDQDSEENSEPLNSYYFSSLLLDEESGNLYVGDETNHCIHVWNVKSGEFVETFGQYGEEETADQFNCITGMCFEKHKKWFFMVDCENNRIKICQP